MSKTSEQPMVVDSEDSWPGLDDIAYEPHFQHDSPFTFGTDPSFPSPYVDPSDAATFDPLSKPSLRGDSAVSFAHGRPFKASSVDTASPDSSGQESSGEETRGRKRKTSGDSGDVFFGAPGHGVAGSLDGLLPDPDVEGMNREMANHFDFDSAASSPGNLGQPVPAHAYANVPNAMSQASMGAEDPSVVDLKFESSPAPSSMPLVSTGLTAGAGAGPGMVPGPISSPSTALDSHGAPAMQTIDPSFWNGPSNAPSMDPTQLQRSVSPRDTAIPGCGLPDQTQLQFKVGAMPPKARVEIQTKVRFMIAPLPPGITKLHLPRHTIGKPKLLAKDKVPASETLELATSLVCTSAMQNPEWKQRALDRAAGKIIKTEPKSRRGSADSSASDDPDKPLNGGEVRICNNCINRENKRSNRRRIKRPEDELPWHEHEGERAVVFNCTEYQDWQRPEALNKTPQLDDLVQYAQKHGGMMVEAPMRVACYCRHQGEKLGFQIIFTLRDSEGNLLGQTMSDSILITDDHKTHAPQPQYAVGNQGYPTYPVQQFEQTNELTRKPWNSYHDLQSLYMNPGLAVSSAPGMNLSPAVSQPVTPQGAQSRRASPSHQVGPNKKRKSSAGLSARIPPELSMTPTTTQASGFAPGAFISASDFMPQSIMQPRMPNGPTTPSSPHAYVGPTGPDHPFGNYSLPGSSRGSGAPSPVASNREAFAPFQGSIAGAVAASQADAQMAGDTPQPSPLINKVIPGEGPMSGGIEITCLGTNFDRSLEVVFGDQTATATTFWGENTLVCLLPPSSIPGPVQITLKRALRPGEFPQIISTNKSFTYIDDREGQLYESALRALYYQDKHALQGQNLQEFARTIVSTNRNGMPMQGAFDMGNGFGTARSEDVLMNCLELLDLDDNRRRSKLDIPGKTGTTMLALACSLGFMRFTAGLLARGADINSRDRSGYTPLMMAVMHGHTKLVRFLILKGADPMLRTYRGYTAHGQAKSQDMSDALFCVGRHNRSRSAGHASLRHSVANLLRHQQPREAAGRWSGYSSEDEYESESESEESQVDDSITPPAQAWARSRRNSTVRTSIARPPKAMENGQYKLPYAPAWFDQLYAQYHQMQHQFQQMHQGMAPTWTFNFQFPGFLPVPNLEAYQDSSVVRRISSLVPSRSPTRPASSEKPPAREENVTATATSPDYSWRDFFTLNATPPRSGSSPPPPAYEDIYPEKTAAELPRDKKADTGLAEREAIADRLCEAAYDGPEPASSSKTEVNGDNLEVRLSRRSISKEQEEQLRLLKHHQKMKKIQHDRKLFLVWLPLMLLILAALLKSRIPQVWSGVTTAWDMVQTGAGAEERIVEVA